MHLIKIVICSLIFIAGCHRVPAGHVGVKVHLLGGEKGVDVEPIGVGRYGRSINIEYHNFPTFTNNVVWDIDSGEKKNRNESISFQTKEGMDVNIDVGLSFSIQRNKVVDIFQKYRAGIEEITHIYLRNMVRDAFVKEASSRSINDLISSGKVDMLTAVENDVREQVSTIGINVERVYYIGQFRFPDVVKASIDATIQATQLAQQRQNEIAQAKAVADSQIETARGTAESTLLEAEAKAKANEILAKSVTPELIKYQAVQKWDGVLPKFSNGNGLVPFLNVDTKEQ